MRSLIFYFVRFGIVIFAFYIWVPWNPSLFPSYWPFREYLHSFPEFKESLRLLEEKFDTYNVIGAFFHNDPDFAPALAIVFAYIRCLFDWLALFFSSGLLAARLCSFLKLTPSK